MLSRIPWIIFGFASLSPSPAPATIEQQRDRLPAAAFDCSDPVAGIWQAHAYYAHVGQWYQFELTIERDDADTQALQGSIRSEFWDGGADRQQPPLCDEGGDRTAVLQVASGQANALEIRFEATQWRNLEICGSSNYTGYLLDRFSGTIDAERMEFQSLLNADAPEWRDVPTVFRRVRCGPSSAAAEPHVVVAPPPYQPPETRGCGVEDSPPSK